MFPLESAEGGPETNVFADVTPFTPLRGLIWDVLVPAVLSTFQNGTCRTGHVNEIVRLDWVRFRLPSLKAA